MEIVVTGKTLRDSPQSLRILFVEPWKLTYAAYWQFELLEVILAQLCIAAMYNAVVISHFLPLDKQPSCTLLMETVLAT